MKNRVAKIILFALLALVSACEVVDMDNSKPSMDFVGGNGEYITSFGTPYPEESLIVTDTGLKLNVVSFAGGLSWNKVKSERVMFNYTIVEATAVDSYNVRINVIYSLVVKDLVTLEGKLPDGAVTSMEDPAMPYQVSYSGGYINIHIYYPSVHDPDEQIPDIDLCYDIVASTDDTKMLSLCHRASKGYDGKKSAIQDLWFSFRVTPESNVELFNAANMFAFKWCWWNNDADFSAGVNRDNVSVMYVDSYGNGGRTEIASFAHKE